MQQDRGPEGQLNIVQDCIAAYFQPSLRDWVVLITSGPSSAILEGDWSLLVKDVRPEFSHDLDYLVSMLDWDANVNPEFAKSNETKPRPVKTLEEMESEGYGGLWITYGTPHYSAKELTVLPKRSVTIKDKAAYGAILTQGHGLIAKRSISTPSMIRFGEMTEDEFFVTAAAAQEGVVIENLSTSDPLVMLKHFGPGNPDAQPPVRS